MPTFKKNPNPIMKRSGFKMKSSPTKGKLDDFFSSLGREATETRQAKQREENEGGLTNFEKRRAEKKERKAGESRFQADVRRGKERRAKEKVEKAAKVQEPYDIKSSSVFEPTKFEHEGKSFFGPTTSDLDRKLMMQDMENLKITRPKSKKGLSGSKTTSTPGMSAQEMINMAYKGTNNDWDKASKNAMDMYGTTLTELIGKRNSPVEKKSPYKKGSRGYKMKRK